METVYNHTDTCQFLQQLVNFNGVTTEVYSQKVGKLTFWHVLLNTWHVAQIDFK